MSEQAFSYQALNASGQTRKGTLEAVDDRDAYRQLTAMGLTPIRLRAGDATLPGLSRRRASLAQIASLTRELSVLVEAKIPLAQGIRSIAEAERNPILHRLLQDIAQGVETGKTLTDSISKHRATFGDVYINTLKAAEKSGNLIDVLSMLAEMLDTQIESRQQLRRALAYPVLVLSVVLMALAVILIFVVPRFGQTFLSSGTELPWITQAIQGLSAWLGHSWWAVALVACAISACIVFAWRTNSGRIHIERIGLRIPLAGNIMSAVITARFARVLGLSLSSGMDVIESLEVSGSSTGSLAFANECSSITERLRAGDTMRVVLEEESSLPGFAQRMLAAGKDASELSRSCTVVARHFERRAEHLTKSINQMLEPLLTIGLAGVVLVVALSVFLPMWQMVRMSQ